MSFPYPHDRVIGPFQRPGLDARPDAGLRGKPQRGRHVAAGYVGDAGQRLLTPELLRVVKIGK